MRIHVPGFGKTNGVEYLNTGWIDFIPYFHDMVEYFVDRGYARGKSIRAAPYDWRLAAGVSLIVCNVINYHSCLSILQCAIIFEISSTIQCL